MAQLSEVDLTARLQQATSQARGPASITALEQLKAILKKVRAADYDLDLDEMEIGTLPLAARL